MPRSWAAILRCCVLVIVSVAASPRLCRADEAADKAAAEALFQLGQRLMNEGNYVDACPKLEASQKLDPGIGTLLFLGDCQEKLGKLASAWATFQDAAALAKSRNDSERARVAELRATALRPRLSYVVFEVPPSDDIEGFELRRRGALIARGSWGVRIPTDPGSYDVVASAPGYETWRTAINVPPDLETPIVVQVPPLHMSAPRAAAAPPPPVPPRDAAPPHAGAERASSSASAQKAWGVVLASMGVAAAVAGGVFTMLAIEKNRDSKAECSSANANLCNPSGVSLRDQAKSLAGAATGLVIGGGVVLVTGVVLFATAPRDERGNVTGLTVGMHTEF